MRGWPLPRPTHAPATAPSPTAKESPNPPNPSCCRSRGGMRGWPVHRPTHAPATAPSPTAKESPKPKNQNPSCRHSVAACVPDHSCGQPMLPQQLPVQPQKNPPIPLTPRAAAPAAACVSDHSLACERIPLRHRSNLQRKKQHRHSGIFRVADLGPGTMPRGKYPESPAPAGSHALISRTPTPGGMLHANLGLPRPTPRNFQLSRGQHTPDTGATPKKKTTSSFRNFPRG